MNVAVSRDGGDDDNPGRMRGAIGLGRSRVFRSRFFESRAVVVIICSLSRTPEERHSQHVEADENSREEHLLALRRCLSLLPLPRQA